MQLHLAIRGSSSCFGLSTAAAAAVLRPHMHLPCPTSTHNTYSTTNTWSSGSCLGLSCTLSVGVKHRAKMRSIAASVNPARSVRSTAFMQCGSTAAVVHVSCISRRRVTVGAALAAAAAGGTPWSWAAGVPASSSRGGSSMAAAAGGGSGPASDTGVLVVYVTAPSTEVGDMLATALVQQQLVACVNIVPGLTSVYTWKGKVEKDSEVLLIMKTQAQLLEQLTAKVKALHPYDEPEVIALPVVGGSASYMQWVRDSTST